MRRVQRAVVYRKAKVVPLTPPRPPESAASPITVTTAKSGVRHAALLFTSKQRFSDISERVSRQLAAGGESRAWRIARERERIQGIVGLNAILSWTVTGMGYVVVNRQKEESLEDARLCIGIKAAICFLSLLQICLVILYRSLSLESQDSVRVCLKLSPVPVRRLCRSRCSLVKCALECCLHLAVLWPNFSVRSTYTVFAVETSISLDDALFLATLCRNYHTLQLIYWWSRFSELRMHHFAKVAGTEVNSQFVLRCYLADTGALFVLVLYAYTVVLSSLLQYTLEKDTTGQHTIWEDFWVVTSTQATLGFGDAPPLSFSGQFAILFTCFCGVVILGFLNSIAQNQLTLSLQECRLYSELLYARERNEHQEDAALLLQCWWRLMRMRLRKEQHGPVIVSFYHFQLQYRSVLTACQRLKDRSFERQVEAFETVTRGRFRALNEYIAPVRDSHAVVSPI